MMRKRSIAEEANQKYHEYFKDNIKAIETAMPSVVSYKDIYITLGSPWIPSDIIDDFMDNCSGNIIQDKLFNRRNNPYDIEHILAQKNFENYLEEDKKIFNGIGNLVVLEQKINRKIKDIPVMQKLKSYNDSMYISVKMLANEIEKNNREWDTGAIKERQKMEIEKIRAFMEIQV